MDLNLPHLSPEDIDRLDCEITLKELSEALEDMNLGKSPGIDGIPPELYSQFWPD